MDCTDDVRAREDEDVAVAAQVLGVVLEALAAEIRFCQLVALDHRAHRAVEDEHALLERQTQGQLGERGRPLDDAAGDSGWKLSEHISSGP